MYRNIVFYLILLCLFISVVMKSFEVIRTIANVICFVFVLLYFKDEMKTYSRKALAILSICFLFLVGICAFNHFTRTDIDETSPLFYRLGNDSGHSFNDRFFKHLYFYFEENFKLVKTIVISFFPLIKVYSFQISEAVRPLLHSK